MVVSLLQNNNLDLISYGIILFRKRQVFKKFLLITQKKAKPVHQILDYALFVFYKNSLRIKNGCVTMSVVQQNTKKYYIERNRRWWIQ